VKRKQDWVNKCMAYEAEGSRERGRLNRTWREVVEEDCGAYKLKKEDATDQIQFHRNWSSGCGHIVILPFLPTCLTAFFHNLSPSFI